MSREEIRGLHLHIADKYFCSDISDIIRDYINIIVDNMCNFCHTSDIAYKTICSNKYNHNYGELTRKKFLTDYGGRFDSRKETILVILDIDNTTYPGKYLDLDKMWIDLECGIIDDYCYNYYNGYLFRSPI